MTDDKDCRQTRCLRNLMNLSSMSIGSCLLHISRDHCDLLLRKSRSCYLNLSTCNRLVCYQEYLPDQELLSHHRRRLHYSLNRLSSMSIHKFVHRTSTSHFHLQWKSVRRKSR